ncbi:hypothetical protein BST91_03255 [Nonlabens tegetincola]|uniref:hypothetical protein n=1 Tax=Nonlabens tegetincola TaxID=323273 RepID=UPI000A2055F0|nr:hypothetical protein [Nonlabens tegetincola]ARN70733.1 hypothetical protein BST91_03255 [Nonlabens tegetincola]
MPPPIGADSIYNKSGLNFSPADPQIWINRYIYEDHKLYNLVNDTELYFPNGISQPDLTDIIILGHPLDNIPVGEGLMVYSTPREAFYGYQSGTGNIVTKLCYGDIVMVSYQNLQENIPIILSRPKKSIPQNALHFYINYDITNFLKPNNSDISIDF